MRPMRILSFAAVALAVGLMTSLVTNPLHANTLKSYHAMTEFQASVLDLCNYTIETPAAVEADRSAALHVRQALDPTADGFMSHSDSDLTSDNRPLSALEVAPFRIGFFS